MAEAKTTSEKPSGKKVDLDRVMKVAIIVAAIIVAVAGALLVWNILKNSDFAPTPQIEQQIGGPDDQGGPPSPEEAARQAYESLGPVTDGKLKNHQIVQDPNQPGVKKCADGSAPQMVNQVTAANGAIHTRWRCPRGR